MNIFDKKENGKKETGLTLILDIRSSSVGAAVAEIIKNGPSIIITTEREHFFFEEKVDTVKFIERTKVALDNVLNKIINKTPYEKPIKSIEIFYGSPWYKTLLKEFNISNKRETTFNLEFIEKTMGNILELNTKKNVIVEKDFVSVLLNGYHTKSPLNKKANKIDVSLYLSAIHSDTQRSFFKIIKKYLKTNKITEHTHPLSTYKILKNIFYSRKNYVLFDVSGEITEISIIRDGKFNKLISIPYGSNYFSRGISKECNYNFETAFSKLMLLCSEEIDPACNSKSQKAFIKIKKDWFDLIREYLEKANISSLPYTFYISTDQEAQGLIKNILEDMEGYMDILRIGRKPIQHSLTSKSLEELVIYKNATIKKDSQISLWTSLVELEKDLD